MAYVKAWEPAAVIEKNKAMDGKIGFFAMPGYTSGTTLPVIVSGSTIGVAQKSAHPTAAVDFLRIVSGKAFQQKMAQQLNLLPVVPAFLPASGVTEQLEVATLASKTSKALPAAPGWATLETENYNEGFFSQVASGTKLTAATKAYDQHAAEVLNTNK